MKDDACPFPASLTPYLNSEAIVSGLCLTHVAAESQRWGGLLLTRLVLSGSYCNASFLEILDDL